MASNQAQIKDGYVLETFTVQCTRTLNVTIDLSLILIRFTKIEMG